MKHRHSPRPAGLLARTPDEGLVRVLHVLHRLRLPLLCAGWLTASACAQQTSPDISAQPPDATAAAAAQRGGADQVLARRQTLAAAVSLACDSDAQCLTLGIGARGCGGPEQFITYSTRDTDTGKLQTAAQAYTQARQQQVQTSGEMSTCQVLPDPGAMCSAARLCELGPGQRGVGAGGAGIR